MFSALTCACPTTPDPGDDADPAEQTAYRADREVRRSVIRVITAHLRYDAAASWQGLNFDFTGVVFDGGDFAQARFSDGTVRFTGAVFSGAVVGFAFTEFSGARVVFDRAVFTGPVAFGFSKFSGSSADFREAEFSGGEVDFTGTEFSGGRVRFDGAIFSGGQVDFSRVGDWSVPPEFPSWGDNAAPRRETPRKD
jgi:uncharacterized protein YjbI with pentapeptide repeats